MQTKKGVYVCMHEVIDLLMDDLWDSAPSGGFKETLKDIKSV